ncbi:MAG: 50S ribosomal protein L6 [Parcubacteria group bacterium ADurb.Bin305]|jgi:large subunit ribosomal protein L6|nr:50S ribosomal protein L6 [Candidatus Paceibacterota bacterium]MDD3434752.1 50S ribosomal protein L6 [Candidatus Paceibacterota bacterium]OQA44133.1 MAG: 50S ribosomal protein L6 [Parcubacteria group bacterium ADurb.Bin305]
MSRLGKKPIKIPLGVEVRLDNNTLVAKGPLGEDSLTIPSGFNVSLGNDAIIIKPQKETKSSSRLWGTLVSEVQNVITGVKDGYSRDLEINGVGFKAEVEGGNLVLKIGYANAIKLVIPAGLEVLVDKNKIKVKGVSKNKVTQFAALIRAQKRVDPYKAKGIKYADEVVRKKVGKKLAGTTA